MFLPGAGPAGTAIGILIGSLAMAVFAFNYHRMLQRATGPGGAYAFGAAADEVEQTGDDTARKAHVTVSSYGNALLRRIDVHNLRVAQHEVLAAGNRQVVVFQIQDGIVRF